MTTIPADCVSLFDYERYFHERVDPAIRAYIAGAAADGITQHENRRAFDRVRIMPRALVDLSTATASTTLFGETLDYPILIGPTAWHKLVCEPGEMATAQAASLTRTWMTVSTQASVSLEAIAQASSAPLWFQLYMQPQWDDTLTLVRRAEQAGYRALVVTVDAPINGIRNVEQRAGFRLPPGIESVNLRGLARAPVADSRAGSPVFKGMLAGAPTWSDIERLARATTLPVVLKGILNPADVAPALAAGTAGLIVSNHGGRTLDTVPATLDVLPDIAAAVNARVPVLLDGAVRRGTDVLKALALGAQAVLLGQPVLHALAVGGVAGVAHMLTILQTELEAAMALAGVSKLEQVPRETVRLLP
ncbi:alpha-hydroxy acid oxidase [Paraburkholderia sp. J67]|uniref:alpha-hydroxy acid oxidase n=1 Tax=Paraburkholderia sp. J67 TaxID=2805435 RepID=UPI002ABD9ECC|nr:alpha-hydroxy acid oxidase [Paraburkholderia sp. J67]